MHYIKLVKNCKYDRLKTWKIIRELVYTSKPKENDLFIALDINNQEVDDPYTISEAFNEFFVALLTRFNKP